MHIQSEISLCPAHAQGRYVCNPYRGCEFECQYCYAKNYLNKTVRTRQVRILDLHDKIIKFSVWTDAYQYEERWLCHTKGILQETNKDNDIIVVTKNPGLVIRDLDILSKFKTVIISPSITKLDLLETNAPKHVERKAATEYLVELIRDLSYDNIHVVPRIDPVIYPINFNYMDEMISWISRLEIKQITFSIAKFKGDILHNLATYINDVGGINPKFMWENYEKIFRYDRRGEWRLKPHLERIVYERIESLCNQHNIKYAYCREDREGNCKCDGVDLL